MVRYLSSKKDERLEDLRRQLENSERKKLELSNRIRELEEERPNTKERYHLGLSSEDKGLICGFGAAAISFLSSTYYITLISNGDDSYAGVIFGLGVSIIADTLTDLAAIRFFDRLKKY